MIPRLRSECVQRSSTIIMRTLLCWMLLLLSFGCPRLIAAETAAAPLSASPTTFRAEAVVLGESAVIDKETGRIFWESGNSNTLSESVIIPRLTLGLKHARSTILTLLLVLAAAGALSGELRAFLQLKFGTASISDSASSSSSGVSLRPFYQTALLSFVHRLLLLPRLPRWFIIAVIVLYLTEAYFCSTRQYLMNAMDSTAEVETYIERLRESAPIVEWKVRSIQDENSEPSSLSKFWRRRKRITHKAVGYYEYNSCNDQTIAAVWKRASLPSAAVPFTKIALSMTLLLKDEKARRDYFRQQRDFVRANAHGVADEFSTKITVPGFRPRILAVRQRHHKLAAILFRPTFFWLFTAIGLTVPYRHWFAAHCDEVRVTVVKETGTDAIKKPKSSSSWFRLSSKVSSPSETATPSLMQSLLASSSAHANETAALLEEGLEAASIISTLPDQQQGQGDDVPETKDERPAST